MKERKQQRSRIAQELPRTKRNWERGKNRKREELEENGSQSTSIKKRKYVLIEQDGGNKMEESS